MNGTRQVFPAGIDVASGDPAFAEIDVVVPLNSEATIQAGTR